MSKLIKMTPECLEQCKQEFLEALSTGKFSDGKVTFTKTLGTLDRKATIFFSEIAWLKMQTLVREFDKEVAWHGIAYRGEEPDTFVITDILVYPQEVTGSTVTTDQEKYQTWLMSHDDDVFNNIRMQGHSHVNMGVTPSGVDDSLYERLLDQLDDDMFYIFMIWNKRKDKTVKIYDLKENVLFETADVTIEILDDGTGIEKFMAEAKEMVVNKPVSYGGNSQYGGGYGGYGSGNYGGGYGNYGTPSGYAKKEETGLGKTQALADSKNKKKKGKRKGKRNKNGKAGNAHQIDLDEYYGIKSGGGVDCGYGYDDYEIDESMTVEEYYESLWRRNAGY